MADKKTVYLKEPISELDRYLFGEGTHYEIYEKLGAHPMLFNGLPGIYFAVWAPHAKEVHLVGDFNRWSLDTHPMMLQEDSGIYDIFVPELGDNELYKFAITTQSEKILFKADPFANYSEYRPGTASVTTDLSTFMWSDHSWISARDEASLTNQPVSIYELHIGSWKHTHSGDKNNFCNYKEIAHELGDYVLDMGYTHIELMGIAEHPYDGSWGYQVTGYFAPTSRYGTPQDFMYFVNHLHSLGIGVLLDWVPAHFPKDAHGLVEFDGESLYEYGDTRKGEHPDWGTKIFDYGKHEVSNFLISNALYWIDKFHIDGLRVDAVASMLYLDYGRATGSWVPNIYGGHENLEAIEFFKHLNCAVKSRGKGAIVIAEESTTWPKVTHDINDDGLGFSFKWNMGWMHDFLEYMRLDPYFRKSNHNKLTFSLTYADSENFILVLSHDEVVHLKASMLNKMPGTLSEKIANLKVAYTFMFGHPGKKLLFMGQDFGQLREWSEDRPLDWFLTKETKHKNLKEYVKQLLHIYKNHPSLSTSDDNCWEGFEWINADDSDRSIFSFIRQDKITKDRLLFICSFTSVDRPDFSIGVPTLGSYTLLLGSQSLPTDKVIYQSEKKTADNRPYSLSYPLEPYGTAIFKF